MSVEPILTDLSKKEMTALPRRALHTAPTTMFYIGFFVIFAALCYVLCEIIRVSDALGVARAVVMLDHVALAFTLLFCGTIVFDLALAEAHR